MTARDSTSVHHRIQIADRRDRILQMLPMRVAANPPIAAVSVPSMVAADRPNMPVTPIENCPPSTGVATYRSRFEQQQIGLRVQTRVEADVTGGENLPTWISLAAAPRRTPKHWCENKPPPLDQPGAVGPPGNCRPARRSPIDTALSVQFRPKSYSPLSCNRKMTNRHRSDDPDDGQRRRRRVACTLRCYAETAAQSLTTIRNGGSRSHEDK